MILLISPEIRRALQVSRAPFLKGGTLKSFIWMKFSIVNIPLLGTSIYGNLQVG